MNRLARSAVLAVGVLAVLAGVFGLVLNLSAPMSRVEQPTRVSQLIYLCQPLLLGSLGCYLAVRRSRHPAGWLMLLAGVAVALESLGQGVRAGGRPAALVLLAGFTARLRAQPDRQDIPGERNDVLHLTVQPGHASLWLAPTGTGG